MLLLLVFLIFSSSWGKCSNILGVFNYASKSHQVLGETLLQELAFKGHNVTMVSPFPLTKPQNNYCDIFLSEVFEDYLQQSKILEDLLTSKQLTEYDDFFQTTRRQTSLTLSSKAMQNLLNSNTKFDLIIMDWYHNEALLIYSHLLQVPVITLSLERQNIPKFLGNPLFPSYIPNKMIKLSTPMSLFERTLNTLVFLVQNIFEKIESNFHNSLLKSHYPEGPSLNSLYENVVLALSNSHYSLEPSRPFNPNTIQVAGLHIKNQTSLSNDSLKNFLDSAKDGVIIFSLGSNLKASAIDPQTLSLLNLTFTSLKQRVVWKQDQVFQVPNNVFLLNSLPQQALLAHPNTKLFITQGGSLSLIEAVYHAVPILGIPLFQDNTFNVNQAVLGGYALKINYNELTQQTLTQNIKELITNPKYKENIKKASSLLKDQPLHPLQNAVFWVEHLLRHEGAQHLHPTSNKLNYFQYFLLDVAVVLTTTTLIIFYLLYLILKVLWALCCVFFKKEKLE